MPLGSIPDTSRGVPQAFPSSLFRAHRSTRVPRVRTSVARISYYAKLTMTTYAAFSQRKPHQVVQRRQPRQEIRDAWAENDGRRPPQHFVPDPARCHPERPKCLSSPPIDGCPILRVLCEGSDTQSSPLRFPHSRHNGTKIVHNIAPSVP
jgi:hypothetical protein